MFSFVLRGKKIFTGNREHAGEKYWLGNRYTAIFVLPHQKFLAREYLSLTVANHFLYSKSEIG